MTERVAKVPGVKLALPIVEGQVFASSPFGSVRRARARHSWRTTSSGCRASPATSRKARSTVSTTARASRSAPKLAEHLSLRIGDQLTLITPHGAQTPFGVTPRMKTYKVGAIFKVGMANFDGAFIFMPLAEAQAFFNLDGQANVIEVYVDDPDHIDAMRDRDRRGRTAADDRHRLARDQQDLLRRARRSRSR